MTLLNTLFHSPLALAKNAEKADEDILAAWKQYYDTIPTKQRIIGQLPSGFGQRKQLIQELQRLLKLELVDVHKIEKDEQEVIGDLHSLDHSERIQKIHRLDDTMCYVETKYKYIYHLLMNLYVNLRKEADTCKKLMKADLRQFRKLVVILQAEFQVELTIIEKIEARETFHHLLLALVKGEEIIEQLTAKEKKIVRKMRGNNPLGSLTDAWVMGVFHALKEEVYRLIGEGALDQHPHADFEFVNGPHLVKLAQRIIEKLQGRKVSPELLNSFVHLFREKYNEQS
ncbi:MAG TPA: hypothetical protein VJI32_06445 [Candidatus Nanoarchaeia archaeon]|nr:hypothetical protein [Candidatus Nanoarchaeia archaeon]